MVYIFPGYEDPVKEVEEVVDPLPDEWSPHINLVDYKEIESHLSDWRWRMNNLYRITDKEGKVVRFVLNPAQERLFEELWYRNIILKARQLGFTTFMLIFMLDAALFGNNVRCGLIAHTKQDAGKLFREKLRFAYDQLPDWLKDMRRAKYENVGELVFNNGSSISVGTSYRGGTLNYLHISEFGNICRKFPDRAKEVVTGAFESVGKNCVITIESTAEGRSGYFHDYCQSASQTAKLGLKLTRLNFKFFFYPWFDDPGYEIDGDEGSDVVVPQRLVDYFVELRKKGIDLTRGQMLWYVLKERTLGEDMKKEYPSTADEAFWQSLEGAYYRIQFDRIFEQKRITEVPHQVSLPVHTAWDIGVNDTNAIWFVQLVGREWRLIDYYEDADKGVDHYAEILNIKARERNYIYGLHIGPHDLKVREWGATGAKTRVQSAQEHGIKFLVAPKVNKIDGINAVRVILDSCVFDEKNADVGTAHLQNYRKEWDDKAGLWKNKPFHGPESNAADAFEYFALCADEIVNYSSGRKAVILQDVPQTEAFYA